MKSQHNEDTDGPEDDCIPFQLQKLFGMLQTSKQRAIATKVSHYFLSFPFT
jgi:hypothetical protein